MRRAGDDQRSVLWWGQVVVPLQGARVVCQTGDDQLSGSGRGAIVGCDCRVPL